MYNLTASFYDNADLDPASFLLSLPYTNTIDFYLTCSGQSAPYPACKLVPALTAGNYYSVRWEGQLWAPVGGNYTFALANVDDGVRLLIDGVEVVDGGWYYPDQNHHPSPQVKTLAQGQHTLVIDYEQRPPTIASAQVRWSGPGFANEVIPNLSNRTFSVTGLKIIPDDSGDKSWNDWVSFGTFTVTIVGTGILPPKAIAVGIDSLTTHRKTQVSIPLVNSQEIIHTYQAKIAVSSVVYNPKELSASVLINDASDIDYTVAKKTFDGLALSEKQRLGIAWYNGIDTGPGRIPQANRGFMQAAGFERIEVTIASAIPSKVGSEYGFVKNQGDVFFYFGHGRHDDNYVYTQPGGEKASFYPKEIGNHWSSVDTVMLFGCSVLEIGDYNNWWGDEPEGCPFYPPDGHTLSPGLAWIKAPGPEVWLGFQDIAPAIGENNGEEAILTWANRYAHGIDPIEAWREATENSSKYRAAVAVDKTAYYFWKEYCMWGQKPCRDAYGRFCIKHLATYEWMGKPLNQIGPLELTALVVPSAANVALHLYDASGRHLGPRADGTLETMIPNALYLSPKLADESITGAWRATIPGAELADGYRLEVRGTATGSFNLFLETPDCQASVLQHTTFISVPVTAGAVFRLLLQAADLYLTTGDNGTRVAPTAHWTSPLAASGCGQ